MRHIRRRRACLSKEAGTTREKKRIVVQGKDWHCNLAVTDVKREDGLVFAYKDGEFVGMWDLGSVDCIWVSEALN